MTSFERETPEERTPEACSVNVDSGWTRVFARGYNRVRGARERIRVPLRGGGSAALLHCPVGRGLQSRTLRSWMTKMRRPERRRDNPKARVVRPPPDGVDLDAVAEQATYESSPYHSTLARIRRPRPDASKCPPEVSKDLQRVELWLRQATQAGTTGVWENGFPRYVRRRVGKVIYEARQGSPGSGVYHGYPLYPEQDVRGLA